VYRCSRAIVARIGSELKLVDVLSWACTHFAKSVVETGPPAASPTLSDVVARFPVLHPDALSLDLCTAISCLPRQVAVAAPEAETVVFQAIGDGIDLAIQVLDR
jgi:hypothetical protein